MDREFRQTPSITELHSRITVLMRTSALLKPKIKDFFNKLKLI